MDSLRNSTFGYHTFFISLVDKIYFFKYKIKKRDSFLPIYIQHFHLVLITARPSIH